MSKIDPMKLVLSVVDSEYPSDISVDELTKNKDLLKSAIKLAEKNGLYYYFVIRLNELNADTSFIGKKRWKEEKLKLSGFKGTIALLNEVSKDDKIPYLLIKACTNIPHVPRDVDIFIRNDDQKALVKALESRGMKCIHSDDVDTTLTKGKYMKVDLYTGLCYFTIEFIDGDFLWRSQLTDNMFGINYIGLKNEANFLIMLVHSLFGHSSMSLLDFLHMKSLMEGIQDIDICRKYAQDMGWGSAFDLGLKELEIIHKRIYENGEAVSFPYLFDQKLIVRCISEMRGGAYDNI